MGVLRLWAHLFTEESRLLYLILKVWEGLVRLLNGHEGQTCLTDLSPKVWARETSQISPLPFSSLHPSIPPPQTPTAAESWMKLHSTFNYATTPSFILLACFRSFCFTVLVWWSCGPPRCTQRQPLCCSHYHLFCHTIEPWLPTAVFHDRINKGLFFWHRGEG